MRALENDPKGSRVLQNSRRSPERREVLQQMEAHGRGFLLQNPDLRPNPRLADHPRCRAAPTACGEAVPLWLRFSEAEWAARGLPIQTRSAENPRSLAAPTACGEAVPLWLKLAPPAAGNSVGGRNRRLPFGLNPE